MKRILLVDDHPMIRTGVEVLLDSTDFEIAGTVESGAQAMKAVERLDPDALLLDLHMPGGSGMDVLRSLRSARPGLRIVLLTAAIEDSDLLEALSLKVDGIVLKNSDPSFLLDCLDSVRHGRSWIDPELRERSKMLSDGPRRAERPRLTPRELQLIGFVRRGLRNRDIAEQIGVTEGTVKTYLHALFEKVGVRTRTELAHRADALLAGEIGRG